MTKRASITGRIWAMAILDHGGGFGISGHDQSQVLFWWRGQHMTHLWQNMEIVVHPVGFPKCVHIYHKSRRYDHPSLQVRESTFGHGYLNFTTNGSGETSSENLGIFLTLVLTFRLSPQTCHRRMKAAPAVQFLLEEKCCHCRNCIPGISFLANNI